MTTGRINEVTSSFFSNVRRSAMYHFESERRVATFRIAGTTTTTVDPFLTQRFESRFDRDLTDGSVTASPTASTPRGEFVILNGVGHTENQTIL
ncbi:hypothetical protein CEXT_350101 [Caerostris extrusa]|uniref:Uncharacterized protein n=1 Tax=Caerostris extrusa TaxID=172846 RepID=A0AAV4P7M7_CAEEX|nr:hypothetical protein CEXT_350101 [Caerostris extrusa]